MLVSALSAVSLPFLLLIGVMVWGTKVASMDEVDVVLDSRHWQYLLGYVLTVVTWHTLLSLALDIYS